eukprot:m.125003 g.125003  ORF g.125003 m.125003 type:complete len:561 (+) comp15731_c0_seq2:228-1910(+)
MSNPGDSEPSSKRALLENAIGNSLPNDATHGNGSFEGAVLMPLSSSSSSNLNASTSDDPSRLPSSTLRRQSNGNGGTPTVNNLLAGSDISNAHQEPRSHRHSSSSLATSSTGVPDATTTPGQALAVKPTSVHQAAQTDPIAWNDSLRAAHLANPSSAEARTRAILAGTLEPERDGNRYLCPACSRSYLQKVHMTRHLRSHLSEAYAFRCTQCPKVFYRRDQLVQHLRTHARAKGFPCTVAGCRLTFSQKSLLHDHLATEHNNQPQDQYSCRFCGFKSESLLYNVRHEGAHLDLHESGDAALSSGGNERMSSKGKEQKPKLVANPGTAIFPPSTMSSILAHNNGPLPPTTTSSPLPSPAVPVPSATIAAATPVVAASTPSMSLQHAPLPTSQHQIQPTPGLASSHHLPLPISRFQPPSMQPRPLGSAYPVPSASIRGTWPTPGLGPTPTPSLPPTPTPWLGPRSMAMPQPGHLPGPTAYPGPYPDPVYSPWGQPPTLGGSRSLYSPQAFNHQRQQQQQQQQQAILLHYAQQQQHQQYQQQMYAQQQAMLHALNQTSQQDSL